MKKKPQSPTKVAKLFLSYLFRDIEYKYEGLTALEKTFCTESEYNALILWMAEK